MFSYGKEKSRRFFCAQMVDFRRPGHKFTIFTKNFGVIISEILSILVYVPPLDAVNITPNIVYEKLIDINPAK